MPATSLQSLPIRPGPKRSPTAGSVPIRAFCFDVYGTVCDFYRPLLRAFEPYVRAQRIAGDAGAMAIEWRNAYARSTFVHACTGAPFRPLKVLQRENLVALLAAHGAAPFSDVELDALVAAWNRLNPWPDAVEGLGKLKQLAVIAPVSNGNFDDMVHLARHAALPWDIILGSSVAQAYKPHPDIYLKSVAALGVAPEEVCMVAAHQVDLFYAAGHGMQTAFVIRREEFGGATKPSHPPPGVDYLGAAEVYPEGDWTYVAQDFLDLAAQCRRARRIAP